MFIDIETANGLIPKGANWEKDYKIFPYIVQFGWSYNNINSSYIVKPKGWIVTMETTKIHGITHDYALTHGHCMNDCLDRFIHIANQADIICGFNIYFDTSILKANAIRENRNYKEMFVKALDKSKRLDLMYKTIKFVGAKQPNGAGKFPSLVELHYKLFNKNFKAHDALEDVLATKRCFEKLIKLKVIKL